MKSKKNQPITFWLRQEASKIDNDKTQRNVIGIIANFNRFLTEMKIEDSSENISQSLMRQYLSWLQDKKNNISQARGRTCINYIFKLLDDVEGSKGLEFHLDRKIVKNYKEPRSMEERRKNHIALTEEEIQRLANLRLDNHRLEVARDIFLLQCYCGFRFEDLSLLLDGKNLKESEGWKYVDFETQKKDIISHTPLNHPNYYPQAYEIYEKYINNSPYTDKHHDKYNKALREVAELAKLDREFTVTSTKGKSKSKKTYKIYEKISSHDGRHTFITNCIRYKGIEPNVLKSITGHADTKLIETVYCNLHEDDKLSALLNIRMDDKIDEVGIVIRETEI